MLLDLAQDLHIARLARVLSGVPNLRDPHARRHAFRRSGLAVSDRDSHLAAENARQRRSAFAEHRCAVLGQGATAEPARDDLVERMAEGLSLAAALGEVDLGDERSIHAWLADAGCYGRHPTRPDLVEPATERAREKLPALRAQAAERRGIGAALGQVGDIAAFALLIGVWIVAYCLVCPPAQAASHDAFITDERVAVLMNLSPVLIFLALVVGLVWWNRGVPAAAIDDDTLIDLAPETMPEVGDFLRAPRDRRS